MNTSDLNLFIRIAETGSITETAKQRDLTPAAVSTALKRLEKELNLALFIRSTRQLRITEQGENFLFYCRQSLDLLEKGQLVAHKKQDEVSGKLRISVPSDLGRNVVLPWIDEMLAQYPKLSIDLNVGDSLSDFYMDQIDLALRYGKLADSSLVGFHIATANRITCASPMYLQQMGNLSHPKDLRKHSCLLYRRNGKIFNTWEYLDAHSSHSIKLTSNRISNDTDIVKRWALKGKGIINRSVIDVAQDIQSGELIPLLTNYESPSVDLYLVCPSRKQVTPAVIAFREMLREKCNEILDASLTC
jgi:DNA-binding transcriptional LysR family regulator